MWSSFRSRSGARLGCSDRLVLQANAVLNRIDLLCEVLLFLMICLLPIMIGLTWLTNKVPTGVLDQSRCCCRESTERFVSEKSSLVGKGLETIKHGRKEHLRQPVLPASFAYVVFYFNVVLAPGSLMTAFLTQRGDLVDCVLSWLLLQHSFLLPWSSI